MTTACGPLCKGHTIYYGISNHSWLSVSALRENALKAAGLSAPIVRMWYDEKVVSAAEVAVALAFGGCAVDTVENIHAHKKVYVNGEIALDI